MNDEDRKPYPEPSTVTISKARFDELRKAEKKLEYLYGSGVDDWQGYAEAMEEMHNDN